MTARILLPAAVVLVLTMPVSVWWLVGDRSSRVPAGVDLDYTIQPLPLSPGNELAIGIAATVLAAVCALLLIWASVKRRLDRRWWSVLGPLLLVGAIVGDGWRTVTAGGIGANIGAGLEFMIGGPVVVVLLLYAGFHAWRLLAKRPR